MLIYVKCLTYGYYGKDHLISCRSTDNLMEFKKRIMELFKVGYDIDIFDDKTERILDSFEDNLYDCFQKSSFCSVSFCKS
jgi:hypothetical protein